MDARTMHFDDVKVLGGRRLPAHMPQNLGFDVELRFPFNDAIGRVKDALKQEGFGILTEIDLQAAFREKLGREFRQYVILGRVQPSVSILCHQR